MMYGWNGVYDHGGSVISWILMPTMIILFIVFIIWLIRYLSRSTRISKTQSSALEILKRRYASGEIDKKQFDQTKKDLNDK